MSRHIKLRHVTTYQVTSKSRRLMLGSCVHATQVDLLRHITIYRVTSNAIRERGRVKTTEIFYFILQQPSLSLFLLGVKLISVIRTYLRSCPISCLDHSWVSKRTMVDCAFFLYNCYNDVLCR